MRHHAEGIFECEGVFGQTLTLESGRQVPVRWIAEQHVQEDLGFIPTLADWLSKIAAEPWMGRGAPAEIKAIEREIGDMEAAAEELVQPSAEVADEPKTD